MTVNCVLCVAGQQEHTCDHIPVRCACGLPSHYGLNETWYCTVCWQALPKVLDPGSFLPDNPQFCIINPTEIST